jgi:D-alanyl-D-alanine carboxypeptidase/D-alanyl-D-alanine-endopeptidase (penicillin-binding protein 4)
VKNVTFALCLLLGFLPQSPLFASSLEEGISPLLHNGTVIAEHSGQTLVSINSKQQFIPASIQKIATALWAINTLGQQYRFVTPVFKKEDTLYIKGEGDPFLVSEEIHRLAIQLVEKNILKIDAIVLDDSRFDTSGFTPGNSLNPYDALNGSLVVNFNTVYVRISRHTISSAEEQTPTLPLMMEVGKGLPLGEPRISLPKNQKTSLRYAGELFEKIFNKAGITVKNGWRHGTVPADADLVFRFSNSKTLEQVIADLLLYSNNFMANQLFLICGAIAKGYPADWEKSRQALGVFLKNSGISEDAIMLREGSGISRENRATAAGMLELLRRFAPYRNLLPEKKGIPLKSGTMQGVFSYAGYFTESGPPDAFVIILNQPDNNRDKILHLLQKGYNSYN